nr:hypothetical protein [uncultured Cohaesibacter sp.]
MSTLDWIKETIGTVNAILDGLKSVKEIAGNNEVQSQIDDLRMKLVTLTGAYFSLYDRYSALEQENVDLKCKLDEAIKWNKDTMEHCEMKTFASGASVIVCNPVVQSKHTSEQPSQSEIYLCPNCFDERHRAILQPRPDTPTEKQIFYCHKCNAEFQLSAQESYRQSNKRGGGFNPFDFA